MYVPGGMMYVLKEMKTEVSLSFHSLGHFQPYFFGTVFLSCLEVAHHAKLAD